MVNNMLDLREVTEFLRDVWGYIVTFVVIAVIFVFIVSVVPVSGNSMNPTLTDGNMVLVFKPSYWFSSIKRNDIVVIRTEDKIRYVKRIIGLPGERVDYLKGFLYINNEPFKENIEFGDNVTTNNFMMEDICEESECPNYVIPENMYLVLGDYRIDSKDSRDPEIGLVTKKEIDGKVVFKVWPISEFSGIN